MSTVTGTLSSDILRTTVCNKRTWREREGVLKSYSRGRSEKSSSGQPSAQPVTVLTVSIAIYRIAVLYYAPCEAR